MSRGKSDPLKVSKALKADPTRTNFGFCHLNGQDFSFDADLTGGGEKSMLVRTQTNFIFLDLKFGLLQSVSVRNVAGLTNTQGSKRIISRYFFR